MSKIQYQPIFHKNQNRILVIFDFDAALVKKLRANTDAIWSATFKAWHIADTEYNRIKCKIPFTKIENILPNKSTNISKPLSIKNEQLLQKLIQLLELKAYSQSTIKTYKNEVHIFFQSLSKVDAENLSIEDIKRYIHYCITTLKLTENTIHSRLNALKFLYEKVLGKDRFFVTLPRPKKHQQLPKVLGQQELRRLFAAPINLKHKAILFIAYSAGLRVSEVINLRLQDIDRERQQLFIYCSKGKKDRYVRLSPMVLDVLEQYYKKTTPRPTNYLFEGQEKGKPYTARRIPKLLAI